MLSRALRHVTFYEDQPAEQLVRGIRMLSREGWTKRLFRLRRRDKTNCKKGQKRHRSLSRNGQRPRKAGCHKMPVDQSAGLASQEPLRLRRQLLSQRQRRISSVYFRNLPSAYASKCTTNNMSRNFCGFSTPKGVGKDYVPF